MNKKRLLGYIALAIVPIAVSCSVSRDNVVLYVMTGKFRNEFIIALTQNYWTNFSHEVKNPTKNMINVYNSLLKETGVGVNLVHLELVSINENTQIKKVSNGKGVDKLTQFLYDCQTQLPEGLTSEQKKTMAKPDPTKCNENNKIIKKAITSNAEFSISIEYMGGGYATKEIPKGEKVPFCAIVKYTYDNNNKLHANIISLKDGTCN